MEADKQKFVLIIDPNEIIVNVSNPKEVKATLSNYTIYTLYGSDISGNFEIVRRYSDFDHVRDAMIKNWPGCYIPPLPKKKAIGNNEFLFVEARRQGLSQFCKEIAQLKHLWYSKQYQILVKCKEDVEKALKQIQQENFHQILLKYTQTFKTLSVKQCEQKSVQKVQKFQQSLKKISNLITAYKQTAQSIFDSHSNNYEQYEVLLKYVFSEYEKHFLSTYLNGSTQGKLIFANPSDQKLIDLIQNLKKVVDEKKIQQIYLLLEKQERQIEAFQQVFKSRNSYESSLKQHEIKDKDLVLTQNKLNAGKQSLLKSIMKSNIEDQKKNIQISIDLNRERVKGTTFLCEFMTIIMADYEIPRFQEFKIRNYYQTIKDIAEFEIKLNSIKEQICDYVLQNANLERLSQAQQC